MTDDEVLDLLRRGNEARAAATAAFTDAYDGAETEVAKCWSAHMVAVMSDEPRDKLRWNMESLRAAEASQGDTRASSLLPTVLGNVGFATLLLARPVEARAWYERALVALESADVDDQRRVAYEAGMRHMLSIIDEGRVQPKLPRRPDACHLPPVHVRTDVPIGARRSHDANVISSACSGALRAGSFGVVHVMPTTRQNAVVRFVCVEGRAGILADGQVFDVEEASGGRLPSDPMAILSGYWDALTHLARVGTTSGGTPVAEVRLEAPVPRPAFVMTVIANYPPAKRRAFPMVVGKSPSSVAGPSDDVVLPNADRLPLGQAFVVPEPELGVVTLPARRHLTSDTAIDYIAGFVVAQDITERHHEFGDTRAPWTWENLPAKTLGKSLDTFFPIGPAIVTPDELADVDDLRIRCWINDELRFDCATHQMLMKPTELVALVSSFMGLHAGTIISCGSPATTNGTPPPALNDRDVIRTTIDGIGTMENSCQAEGSNVS
jgi:2-keto-4-pentenoate hydratase/2-oxohepta-3-ene-1,7-dioic acid hydratase in catechol pathway